MARMKLSSRSFLYAACACQETNRGQVWRTAGLIGSSDGQQGNTMRRAIAAQGCARSGYTCLIEYSSASQAVSNHARVSTATLLGDSMLSASPQAAFSLAPSMKLATSVFMPLRAGMKRSMPCGGSHALGQPAALSGSADDKACRNSALAAHAATQGPAFDHRLTACFLSGAWQANLPCRGVCVLVGRRAVLDGVCMAPCAAASGRVGCNNRR